MNEALFEIPARTLARKLGIQYTRIHRDILAGIIPARRYGRLWMIPLNDARVQQLFKDKESYLKIRRNFVKRANRPVVYNGKLYETQAELADILGVSRSTVRYWLWQGKVKFAEFKEEGENEGRSEA